MSRGDAASRGDATDTDDGDDGDTDMTEAGLCLIGVMVRLEPAMLDNDSGREKTGFFSAGLAATLVPFSRTGDPLTGITSGG